MVSRTKKASASASPRTVYILPPERVANSVQVIPLCFTILDVARLLSVSRRTVERLIASGELAAVGTGKLKRVLYASIMDYVEQHLQTA